MTLTSVTVATPVPGLFVAIGRGLAHVVDVLVSAAPEFGPSCGVAVIAVLVLRRVGRAAARTREAATARWVEILPPPDTDLDGAASLWTHLMAITRPAWLRLISGQPHLAWEYLWTGGRLRIGCWIPGHLPPGLVEAAVTAAWPGASTNTHSGDQIPPAGMADIAMIDTAVTGGAAAGMAVTGGVLRLAEADHLPVRATFTADPLRALIAAADGLGADETAWVQICARPATGHRLTGARRAARRLRTGPTGSPLGGLAAFVVPGARPSERAGRGAPDPMDSANVRAITDKATGPRWEVCVRFLAAAPATPAGRRRPPARLRGRADQLASAFALYTERNRWRRRRLRHPLAVLAARRMGAGDLLSAGELAAIAHLPLDAAVPGLDRATAKPLPCSPAIPRGGPGTKPLGDADIGARPVALGVTDARRHLHVLGPTGSGKSTLLLNLILADAADHRGIVVIDPRGDLVTDTLDRLPVDAAERTVIIDPDADEPAPAFNPLRGRDPEVAVDQVAAVCRALFQPYWGPRTDDTFRASALSLLAARPDTATLADVPRLLTSPRERADIVADIEDRTLWEFWQAYEALGEPAQAQVIAPLLNKLRAFLLRRFVRHTIASPAPTFSVGDILDGGGILLVRLPQGTLGEETAHLLGSLLVAQVWQAITARAAVPENDRPDCTVYLDEFQHFLHLPTAPEEMLAEARGFHLSVVLAHQNLSQLTERSLRDGVAANARNKLWFRTSPKDADELEEHMVPYLTAHDLANLGTHQVAARLLVDGADAPPCTLRTRPAPDAVPGRAAEVRAASARRYGRVRHERRNRNRPVP